MISGGADDQELFRELLRLKNGVPSHVTVSRIFRLLDPSAFASATRLVIVPSRFSSAAPSSARAPLRCLELEGRLVTADAVHCETETARPIRERGGDYLLRLEANRPALQKPALQKMVASYFDIPDVRASLATAVTTDGDHGRIETRRAWVSHDLSWMRGSKTNPTAIPTTRFSDATVLH